MKKKGFTLIELLAVIVILAIIALIATPIVMNMIENSRKGAAERSAENYMDAVETTIASERLKGSILDGEYVVQENGNLCPRHETCTEETEIKVDMNGNKPNEGAITIVNGILSTSSSISVGDYTLTYNSESKTYVGSILEPVCTYKGTDESKRYALGAEYECELGDGQVRVFYVLEDGETSGLTRGDGSLHYEIDNIGTAASNEVALIMDRNYPYGSSAYYWCKGSQNSTECNANGLNSGLNSIRNKWTKLDGEQIGLPTYAQIYAINNSTALHASRWIYDYLQGTSNPVSGQYGYWTSTGYYEDDGYAWAVEFQGIIDESSVNGGYASYNIRPVITVFKNQLG